MRKLSAYQIKIIAITAMLIDHMAWAFLPLQSPSGQVMHLLGRITAPLMCFFVSEGFFYTRNLKKYILRMAFFAAVSAFAFSFFETGKFYIFNFGMVYTLLLGLLSLTVWHKTMLPDTIKAIIILCLIMLSTLGDCPIMGVLWVFMFGYIRNNKKTQIICFIFSTIAAYALFYMATPWYYGIYGIGMILAVPILLAYSGELGSTKNSKWLFYIFYPLHLFVLGVLRFYV